MRTIISMATCVALTACVTGPGDLEPDGTTSEETTAVDEPTGEPGPVVHELTLPVRHAASHAFTLYAEREGDQAIGLTELSYGLLDGYPRRVEVVTEGGFVLAQDCELRPGEVIWSAITEVEGTAAKLTLEDGALGVELLAEGAVSAVLTGVITELDCALEDQSVVHALPLRHRIELKVREVAGFEVEQFHQVLADCWDAVVLPSDALLWAPIARPVDANGAVFAAINAPTPVTITLRSQGGLRASTDGQFTAGPGAVDIAVATELPVRGLEKFTVVGPEALTAVEAALVLQKAAAKGSIVEPIEVGGSHEIFFPEMSNTVEVRVDSAMTGLGELCAKVPAGWFAAKSATPAMCVAGIEGDMGAVSVARIEAAGECRLEVWMPGTDHAWATRFVAEF
jgi:hypothetical protein